MLPLNLLDRFKLAGVVATWWNDTLPDFKTLIEIGFAGVIDGWIDAIADAVEDDDNVGPAFDPFAHKLVRRIMDDYLGQINDARAEIARLKGEKEAFEQSNPPEDADEEELGKWSYAKDLEGQIKTLKARIKEALAPVKELKKGLKEIQKAIKAASKVITQLTGNGSKSIARADKTGEPMEPLKAELARQQDALAAAQVQADQLEHRIFAIEASVQPQHNEIDRVKAVLAPYEQTKTDLTAARQRYRDLMGQFVAELRARCGVLDSDEQQALVLELFAGDLQAGLDAAVTTKRQRLIRSIVNLWDKYAVPLDEIQQEREKLQSDLSKLIGGLGYI